MYFIKDAWYVILLQEHARIIDDSSKTSYGHGDKIQDESQLDEFTEMDDDLYVSDVAIKHVGECKVPCLKVSLSDDLHQWISLDGHIDLQFIDMKTCIDCEASLDSTNMHDDVLGTDSIFCEKCLVHHPEHACLRCERYHISRLEDVPTTSCSYLDHARQPDTWWPRCLSDHVLILVVRDDFMTLTWDIILKSEINTIIPLLGGSCHAIFGNEDTIMDFHDAMAIAREFEALFKEMAPNPTTKTAFQFFPEWQYSLPQRIAEFLQYNTRTCNDGGLWLNGLACFKDQVLKRARSRDNSIDLKIPIGYHPEFSTLTKIILQIVDRARSANNIDFSLLDVDVLGTDDLPIPNIDSILTEQTLSIHGIIAGHHGSIVIFQRDDKNFGIDIRRLIGTQPVFVPGTVIALEKIAGMLVRGDNPSFSNTDDQQDENSSMFPIRS